MSLGTHVRLCLKDLYAQDVVEMIERETRKYEVESIEHPDHPDFKRAFQILWDAFGAAGEMEPEAVIREMMLDDSTVPLPCGTYARYFLLVARDRATGAIRGVRDGRVLVNPAYDAGPLPRLPLAHLHAARGARHRAHLLAAHRAARPRRQLPPHAAPEGQDRAAGARRAGRATSACASTSRPRSSTSAPRTSSRSSASSSTAAAASTRSTRGTSPTGSRTSAIPELIARTGDRPVPFMLLLRRVGREREARLPIDEARAVIQLLYDDFETFLRADAPRQQPRRRARPARGAAREGEERRGAAAAADRRARPEAAQAALPLRRVPAPLRAGARDRRGAAGRRSPPKIAANPHWLDEQLARIAEELAQDAALGLREPRQGLRPRRCPSSRPRRRPVAASRGTQ